MNEEPWKDEAMLGRAMAAHRKALETSQGSETATEDRERLAMIAALEAASVQPGSCPFDDPEYGGPDIEMTEPCPTCGMLGTPDAEDRCIGGPRRDPVVRSGQPPAASSSPCIFELNLGL